MVGDGQHVEAVLPVQVDELGKRQVPVTPRRMCVKLAEQQAVHHFEVLSNRTGPGGLSCGDPGSKR